MSTVPPKVAIVTGVTGQMGSYMVEFLLAKGLTVIGTIRRLSVENHDNIKHITDPNFSLAPMDLCDSHSINALVETHKPAYFINCAANSFVGSSWSFPEQHMDYNALGVMRELEAIKRFSPSTRYINFGSSEEFGDVAYSPQDEKHPGRARSIYGASKIAARQIVKVYRESFNLYAIQCWCFNYESERRGPEFVTRKITLGVARIAKAIKDGVAFEPIELGNIDAKRDWSHAEDFVDGIWRMLNQEAYPAGKPLSSTMEEHTTLWIKNGWQPQEYALASGESHSVRDFIEKAFAAANIAPLLWEGAAQDEKLYWVNDDNSWLQPGGGSPDALLVRISPEYYRPADVEQLLGNATRAREGLGWKPCVSFDELVSRMVKADLAAVGL